MRINRSLIFAVAALVVVAAAAAMLLWGLPPTVEAVVVRSAPLVRSLQFSARVATQSRVDVGATVTGRVAQVAVREGDRVRKGAPLIVLETDELRSAVDQAVAAERQAQARLSGLRSTGRSAAAAALAQATATRLAAQAELTRAEQLVTQGFVSASRIDDARRAVDVARSQEQAAQAQVLANADAGTDVVQAEAQLNAARAATLVARARLTQASIAAPADALVLARNVEPGQIVQAGKALLSLALAGPTQLSAQADERFLNQLQPGQRAAVVADAFPGQRFTATVLSVAPVVDAQRGAIEVKFSIEPPAPSFLREDMTLSVEVETARRDKALVMPLAALRTRASDGVGTAWLAQDGRVQERVLRLGLRTLDAVEVLEGLSEGDAVLLGARAGVGSRVRPEVQDWKPQGRGGAGSGKGDAASALTNAMGR